MAKERIPAEIKKAVFATFTCCAACGTWDADECGHIVAEAKGGQMVSANFVRLCGSCNRAQGTAFAQFAQFAQYTEARNVIIARRAMWTKYCRAAATMRVKPYCPK